MSRVLMRRIVGLPLLALLLAALAPRVRADPAVRFLTLVEAIHADTYRREFQATLNLARFVRRRDQLAADLPRLHRFVRNHRKWRVRRALVDILAEFRDPRSIQELAHCLQNDSEWRVRGHAARALGRVKRRRESAGGVQDPRENVLVAALRGDAVGHVRMHAAHALVEIEPRGAISHLRRGLLDARRALEGLDLSEVEDFLTQCIDRATALVNVTPGIPFSSHAAIRPGVETVGWANGTMYRLYTPTSYDPNALPSRGLSSDALLVSVHGTIGNAARYLNMCRADADRHRHLVIAPQFDFGTFPLFGNLFYAYGWERSDLRLLQIVRSVGRHAGIDVEPFKIFGHSQGGQFVHRFVLAHPDRIGRAAACASGYYLDPELDDAFPYGIADNPLMPGMHFDFGRLVTSKMAIVIGTLDRTADRVIQRTVEEPDKPIRDRRRRLKAAEAFATQVREYAAAHGLRKEVKTRLVEGGRHSGSDNYPIASHYLFTRLAWGRQDDF